MMKKISEEFLKQLMMKRKPISYKGVGRLCLTGGDQQYGGAVSLASQVAIHARMGEALAGTIANVTAQLSLTGILAAVYLHSYIGVVMGEKQYVVLPTDIISQISSSMKQFEV